ncbi:MAG: aspartyl/asparaginyl beta-hydroxylase domain-containing protein [Myxococcota bacterium]
MEEASVRLDQLEGDVPWEGRSFWQRHATHAVNHLFFQASGGRARPAFYDIDETFPALRLLDENAKVIREELDAILPESQRFPSYQDIDDAQREVAAEGRGDWKVFVLYAMGAKPERNRAACPRTAALLDRIPDLFQAMFSILEPGKSIPPHRTGWMGYLRYHLPLIVPRHDPPSIRVKDRWHTWQEGESILIDDSWEHEVRNESDGVRVVLIVDVLRPMPRYAHLANKLMALGARRVYAKGLLEKLERHAGASKEADREGRPPRSEP